MGGSMRKALLTLVVLFGVFLTIGCADTEDEDVVKVGEDEVIGGEEEIVGDEEGIIDGEGEEGIIEEDYED
jgi:hypothetical protein